MEPIRVKAQDFTCYKDVDIDLSPVSLAALVGPNGAGKSSLIDMILFALYGQSSKGGVKELDAHVRPGAEACRVEFDFRLGGETYRVLRIRDRKRQKSALEIFQLHGGGGLILALSGKNIAETQEKIENLLRMDYDSITASAIILQGQSGNLTGNMTDGDRRKVFDRILGLDLYDLLLELAKERKAQADAEVALIQQEAGDLDALRTQAAEKDMAVAMKGAGLSMAEENVAKVQQQVADVEAKAKQKPLLEQQAADVAGQIRARQADFDRIQVERQEGFAEAHRLQQTVLGRQIQIQTDLGAAKHSLGFWQDAEQNAAGVVTDWEPKALQESTLAGQIRDLDQQITQKVRDRDQSGADGQNAKTALDREKSVLDRSDEIRAAAQKSMEVSQALQVLEDQAAQHEALTARQRALQDAFLRWKTDLDARIRIQEATLETRRGQAGVLDNVPCGDDLRPVCPLLANGRQAAAAIDLIESELGALRAQTFPQQDGLTEVAGLLAGLNYDAEAHKRARTELTALAPLANLLPALNAAEARAAELRAQVADYANRWRALDAERKDLAAQKEAAELLLMAVRGAGAALAQAKADWQNAQAQKQRYMTEVARLEQSLADADRQETEASDRIRKITDREQNDLNPRQAELQREIDDLRKRATDLFKQIEEAKMAAFLADHARQDLTEAKATETRIRSELAALQAEAASLTLAIQKAETLGARLQEAQERALVYSVLVRACGKKGGIPALIRENAVPQVESIANDLLARMAAGRLQIRLDTQAATKNQETLSEVLRITVLDQGEARNYQTYSGAERFMVDLSLRIALARFLAHRAGAEIQTFVLDEGLGALDAANRQEVMAALNTVATEFRKVIVITHIPELQESLPQRIEVRRTPMGSKVQVIA